MTSKSIQNTIIGLVFLTLLTPFILLNGTYFPYIVGKAFFFRTIVIIAFILWGLLVYKDKSYLPPKSGVCMSFGALTFIYLISALLGPDTRESIFNNFERMDGWITIAFIFVLFVVTSSVMKSKKIWESLFLGQIITSLILILTGLSKVGEMAKANGIDFKTYLLNNRMDSSLGNPIYLAIVLMFSVFFALYLMFERYNKNIKIFLAVTIVINSIGIFLTGTRGVMLGMFVAFVFLLVAFLVKHWKNTIIRSWILAVFALMILVPVLLFNFKDSAFIKSNPTLTRLTQINITEGTGYARFINWGIAVEGFKERPIIGWGHGGYSYVFDKHYDPRMYAQEPFFDRAHNIVLDTLVHGGIFALIAYLSLFGFTFYYLLKNTHIKFEERFILIGLLMAYFVQNIFVFDNLTSYILFVYVLAFATYSLPERNIKSKINKIFLPISVILSSIALIYAVYYPYLANTNLLLSMKYFGKDKDGNVTLVYPNGISDNQKFLEKALDKNLTGISEIIFASTQPSFNLLNIQTQDPKIKSDTQNIINFVMNKVDEEVNRVSDTPNAPYMASVINLRNFVTNDNETDTISGSSRTFYIAGATYARNNDFEKAEELLTKAVEISPNRQIYLTMLANIKVLLKKENEQVELLKRAYEVEKSNEKAWIEYISVLQKVNKEEFLREIEIAKQENKIDKLISFFDEQIKSKPDNPQLYINKVVILAQVGMFKEAISELEKIEIQFPEIKSQTKTWKELFQKGQLPK